MRTRSPQVARQMPRMRRMEHVRRGGNQPWRGALLLRLRTAPGPSRSRRRDRRGQPPPARRGRKRSKPRAGRRHGKGLAYPVRRRTGNRQVDPRPATRPRQPGVADTLRIGRGVAAADQDACEQARRRRRRVPRLCGNPSRRDHPTGRGRPARPDGGGLHPDDLQPGIGIVARQRVGNAPPCCSNTPKPRAPPSC